MADEIGISRSYLNHLERNQRPVTAGMLLRLAEAFDVDVKSFAAEGGEAAAPTSSPRFSPTRCSAISASPRYELVELADNAPAVAEAIARLYTAVRRTAPPAVGRGGGADPRSLITPENWVRDYIQAQRNHYPELEEASETLGGALGDPLSMAEPLRQRLKEAWGVEARVVDPEMLDDASQHYDPQRRDADAVVAAAARKSHLRHRLSARVARVRADHRQMVEAARPPDAPAAAACCT